MDYMFNQRILLTRISNVTTYAATVAEFDSILVPVVIDVDFDVVVWQELLSSTLSFYLHFVMSVIAEKWQLRRE